MLFESVDAAFPLGAEGFKPGVELSERLGPEAVEAALRVAPDLHQAGLAQDPQVARDARLRHADVLDEVADGALADPDRIEDAAARGLGDGFENGRRGHEANIWYGVYKRKSIYG